MRGEVCCTADDDPDSGACVPAVECQGGGRTSFACDSVDDCMGGDLCCGDSRTQYLDGGGTQYWSSQCAPVPDGGTCANRGICTDRKDCPDNPGGAGSGTCITTSPEFFPPGRRVCN